MAPDCADAGKLYSALRGPRQASSRRVSTHAAGLTELGRRSGRATAGRAVVRMALFLPGQRWDEIGEKGGASGIKVHAKPYH